MSQRPASHRFLLTLSQPWFNPSCEECNQLGRIKLRNGVAAICRLIERGQPCEKVNEMNLEQFMQSMADKFANIDELNRVFVISALDKEFALHLEGKNLSAAQDLLTKIALETGETGTEDLKTLFNEKLSAKLPDLQRMLVASLLKHL